MLAIAANPHRIKAAHRRRRKVASRVRFPGQYFDSETGLAYNYFRDYEPGTGRYVESDPIGLNGGLNSYRYAYANPLGYLDQYGLCTALYCLPTTTTSRLVSRTQVSDSGWQYDNYHEYDHGFPSGEPNVLELIDLGIDLPSQFKGEIRVQCMYHRTKRYDDRYVNVRVTACLELCTDCENRGLRWVNHENIAGYFNREDIDVRSMYLDVEAGIPAITCLEILKDLR